MLFSRPFTAGDTDCNFSFIAPLLRIEKLPKLLPAIAYKKEVRLLSGFLFVFM